MLPEHLLGQGHLEAGKQPGQSDLQYHRASQGTVCGQPTYQSCLSRSMEAICKGHGKFVNFLCRWLCFTSLQSQTYHQSYTRLLCRLFEAFEATCLKPPHQNLNSICAVAALKLFPFTCTDIVPNCVQCLWLNLQLQSRVPLPSYLLLQKLWNLFLHSGTEDCVVQGRSDETKVDAVKRPIPWILCFSDETNCCTTVEAVLNLAILSISSSSFKTSWTPHFAIAKKLGRSVQKLWCFPLFFKFKSFLFQMAVLKESCSAPCNFVLLCLCS